MATNKPNDDRSNVKNQNNPANKAAQDNRSNQMNQNQGQQKGGTGTPAAKK